MNRLPALLLAAALSAGCAAPGASAQNDPYDTGGPLMPEQAAYDVRYYALDLAVSPQDSTIEGSLRVVAGVHSPIDWFVLDLDPVLQVRRVASDRPGAGPLRFENREGKLWIKLPVTRQPGDTVDLTVAYGGRPRIAPRPPWNGGFTWARTPSGAPWIATSCQGEGADVWWPVKDHVSDKPDSMAIRITVPDPLVVASNGRQRGMVRNGDGTSTYDWFVSTPISAYNVALNIAPYRLLETSMTSVDGSTFPIQFFVLPENVTDGERLLPEILDHLAFYEENLGPYPFRADKYGVAQTPHLGMEHQTIIAYGANFDNGSMTGGRDWGYDALHHHELAHEWWGNLVTNADWSDMWLHEGFGAYMQPLYLEQRQGPDRYHEAMRSARRGIRNNQAVAPYGVMSGDDIYTGDIYSKGAWILHSLRYLVGDEDFFVILRRMAYPDPAMEAVTDGRQTRFATTEDFRALAEAVSGRDLSWFFEVYLRQPVLPELVVQRRGDRLSLRWRTPDDLPFPMPVDVRIGGRTERVAMAGGRGELRLPEGTAFDIDPDDRVLRAGNRTR